MSSLDGTCQLLMSGTACRRDTFEEFMAQDRHYPAAASKVYSQALVKASGEGPAVFATVREMLEDCHEELSLHAHYTEVGRRRATPWHHLPHWSAPERAMSLRDWRGFRPRLIPPVQAAQ